MVAVVGNKLFPRIGDWYLGKTGVAGQQTKQPDAHDRPDNLDEPVETNPGAHGGFDDRAHGFSIQLFANIHRGAILLGAAAGAAITGVVLWNKARET